MQSAVVYDQLYVGCNHDNPKSHFHNLRVIVNNLFLGKKFDKLDIIYLDRNRIFQTNAGISIIQKIDRIMGWFNLQYMKMHKNFEIIDINSLIKSFLKDSVKNKYLYEFISKFYELSNHKVRIIFTSNYELYKNDFIFC